MRLVCCMLQPACMPAAHDAPLHTMQGGALEAAEAARIFEGQLAGALVAEDGQLALSNLAASAAHGFMPKIQTQGQLGQARWRLVSAPSIPGSLRQPHGLLPCTPRSCPHDQ